MGTHSNRELTPRQLEVLTLIERGHTNQEIADVLGISFAGAKWHVSELLSIYGVESRDQLAEARRQRWWRGWWPASLVSKALVGGAVTGMAVAGMLAVVVAFRGRDSDPAGPPPVENQAARTDPQQQPRCPEGQLATLGSETVEAGAVVSDLRIAKPRACAMREIVEAFVVEEGTGFSGPRLASATALLDAPVGTDRVELRVVWSNWCGPVPVKPTLPPDPHPPIEFPSIPAWVRLSPGSGTSVGTLYPPCEDPARPPAIALAVKTFPDPPNPPVRVASAPPVRSAADLEAFARWFGRVVEARDAVVMTGLLRSVVTTCPEVRLRLCEQRAAGATQETVFRDANGSLGLREDLEREFQRLAELTLEDLTGARRPSLLAAGCADGAARCERFAAAVGSRTRSTFSTRSMALPASVDATRGTPAPYWVAAKREHRGGWCGS